MWQSRGLKTSLIAALVLVTLVSHVTAQCGGGAQADIVFVLDASGSVGSSNFVTLKYFVRDLVDGFDIGSNTIRVGVEKYSSSANTEFNLNTYYDKNTMKNVIVNIYYTRGGTNTGGALDYLRNTMFTSGNGDRSGVPNIGVVISDGISNSPSYTISAAANCRAAGITMFAVGVGSGIPMTELNAIATDPDSAHVFAVSGFGALGGISSTFQAAACPAVNGNWGSWSSWGTCSQTCNTGSWSRSRACDNPAPSNGGASCSGSSIETTNCFLMHCPVHGAWTTWTSWGTCSVTCNVGTHSRSRTCTNPAPAYGGSFCSGHDYEVQNCDVGPSVDGCNYSGATCSSCILNGYVHDSMANQCRWCKTNFTGCSCENCQTSNHIGYNSDCGVLCYHGLPDVPGGRVCVCYRDTTNGHWAGSACDVCHVGWMSPLCTTCDTDYVGPDHCTIRCRWGQGYHVYTYDGDWASKSLTPTFDCVTANSDGTYTAYFGYVNSNDRNLYISPGTANYLDGVSGTPPTHFRPGTYNYVWSTSKFNPGTSVSWTLSFTKSNTVFTVNVPSSPTICPSPPTSTEPTGAIEVLYPGHCHCMPGYYGSECQYTCPGGVGNPCYNHGTCDQTTGACTCDPHYSQSSSCQYCDTNWIGNDCTVAVPPSSSRQTPSGNYMAAAYADGSFLTFDGAMYTYNGLGEHLLWESRSGMTGQVTLTGRNALTSSNSLATSLDAVSITAGGSTMEIFAGMAEDSRDGKVFIDGVETFVGSTGGTLTTGVDYRRLTSDHYQIEMTSNYVINVYVRGRTLEVTVESNSYSCYQTFGLLASCDGDASNDFKALDGTVLTEGAGTLTRQNIHETFGASYFMSEPGKCTTQGGTSMQADIVFVLDSSGSVGAANFELLKQFVQDVVNTLEIASDKIRVGVEKYSSSPNTEFHLNAYYDKTSMITRIGNIVFQSGGTNTGGALDYLRQTMFTSGNGDRSGVQNIGIVISDGVSNSPTYTATAAADCRNAGITMFAVGVGSGIPLSELNEIATDPDSDHVYTLSGFTALSAFTSTFQSSLCTVPQSSFQTAYFPPPHMSGSHVCFDRTYLVSDPMATFSNNDVTIELKVRTDAKMTGCGVLFSYRNTHIFSILACSTYLEINYDTTTVTVPTITITSGEWYHLSFVWFKSSEILRVRRLDFSSNVQTTDVSLTALSFNPLQPGGTFMLGRYNWHSTPVYLNWGLIGCIDDFRIWEGSLSNTDIDTKAWTYVQKTETSLSSVFRFDEGEGHTTKDQMSDAMFNFPAVESPWTKPQWNKSDYTIGSLTYASYELDYNTTGSYTSDFELETAIKTFCNNLIYGSTFTSACSSLGAGHQEAFYLQCLYSGVNHRTDSKTMEIALAYADYCKAITGTNPNLEQNLCNTFFNRTFPNYSGGSCTSICQSGTIVNGQCVCAEGYWGAQCDQACPATHRGPCNGVGICSTSAGTCTCPDNFDPSSSDCTTCKTGWYGEDCSMTLFQQYHRNSSYYYMCSGYEGGQYVTFDGLTYTAPQAGEYQMMSISGLELYVRQVACQKDKFCITGVWAYLGGDHVAIRAPMSSGDAIVEINGSPTTLDATMTLATYVSVELYSPRRYLLHYRNRYDVIVRVYDNMLEVQAMVRSSYCNMDSGLCGKCNGNANDDLLTTSSTYLTYTTATTKDIVDGVLPNYEVPSSTNTYFIYQTPTYTEPREPTGDGYSLSLDKTALESQYMDVLSGNDIVTFDFQVKPDSTTGGTILGFTSDEIVSVEADTTYKIRINNTVYDSGVSVTSGEWNHVTMTYFRNNGTVSFLVDKENAANEAGSVTVTESIFNSPGVLTVGGLAPRPGEPVSSVPSPTFVGDFDNLRIWNRTFDPTTAKQNSYTVVNSTSFEGLVSQWTFSEGSGSVATDDVSGLEINVPRVDTVEWQLSGPVMNVISGLDLQEGTTNTLLLAQQTGTVNTSSLLASVAAAETFCNDLIYNSQVHADCSASLGTQVAVFFYDKCRSANIYETDPRLYSVQSLVDYALHCKVLTNPTADPIVGVCQNHSLLVSGNLCTENGTCRFGSVINGVCVCTSGYWGTECSKVCPGGASSPCNNHGTCNTDTGLCVCSGKFTGSTCSSCASGWSGSNCDVMVPNPSDPWLTASERICSISTAGSVMAFGGKKFDQASVGDFYFVRRNPSVAGSTGVQARLIRCLSSQICVTGLAFYNGNDQLAIEVDSLTNNLRVSINDVEQLSYFGQMSAGTLTMSYLSSFSIVVNDTQGMNAVVGLIDSRLSLVLKTPNTQMGLTDSLCGDGTVNTADTTVPGSETLVNPADVIFNSTVSTTLTTTSAALIPTNASYGTSGGSLYLNQTFLSSDPTSGLFRETSPGTIEMFVRPYESQGVLFSYGLDSTFSVFLNGTLQVALGNEIIDTGFVVPAGEWSEVAVAWSPDLGHLTVYHVTDNTTMDFRRFTVTNMSCFQDGGVMTVGKWRQPSGSGSTDHPPTSQTYLGEVDEMRLWAQDLSYSDILSGFQQPVDTTDPTLSGRWTFDEGQGLVVNDFRGTHLYVTDHSQTGTVDAQWRLSDAPVYYDPGSTSTSAKNATVVTDADSVCTSAINAFTTGNCPGISTDIKAFYKTACLDLVLQSNNLTKAGEVAATMVALCNVGSTSSTILTVADYWCNDYAGNYLLGTGTTCSQTCLYPNTTLSTRTSCVCADGYWGPECNQNCPGGGSNVCNGHGTCNSVDGSCDCQVNWRGAPDCSQCTAGWTGADCSVSYLANRSSTICTATNMGRFTMFDGSSAQHPTMGAYLLYDSGAGVTVTMEQAPCSRLGACNYRAILTVNTDILTFDLTIPSQGVKVVRNGVEIYPSTTSGTLWTGYTISRPVLNKFTVATSNSDFQLDVTVREAHMPIQIVTSNAKCASSSGVCGPCQTQSISGCSLTDAMCLIGQLGVREAVTHHNLTSTDTSDYIASQRVNVTSASLGYTGGSSFTGASSQVETAAGYGLSLNGTGASSDTLPASTIGSSNNITLEAVIKVESPAEGTVLSYSDEYTFAISINNGVFQVQCADTVENTGISAEVGNWSHVSVVYDNTTGRALFNYIDSNTMSRYKVLNASIGCFPDQGRLSVGQYLLSKSNLGSIPSGHFKGGVDRVMIWNRRFGPADFLNHWTQDIDPSGEPDLACYWNLNEGQGTKAVDAVQGVILSLPNTDVWTVSSAPIDETTSTLQQDTTGATSVLNTYQQNAVDACTWYMYNSSLATSCGLLSERVDYYYVSCVSDATQARDVDFAMDSVLDLADECQTTLGLSSWPAQYLCNNFTSRVFPIWFGSSCTLQCVFGSKIDSVDACACDEGYWGASCDQVCPGAPGTSCNGHGTCLQATGSCACNLQWQGDSSCGTCTSGWTGSDCSIMSPASGSRPPTMCTVDRGGFLLTFDLYGVTLDQPATYTVMTMDNLQIQITQVACSVGLCVQGVGINYHDRNLVVSLDDASLLDVYVDGTGQGRGVDQSLDPSSIVGCTLTVTWRKDTSLVIGLSPLNLELLVNAVGPSLSVVVKSVDSSACCGSRMTGLCGSCGTCSGSFTDTCQLTSSSPAPAPLVPVAPSCSVSFSSALGQSALMSLVGCSQVNSTYNMFSSLLNSTSLGMTSSFYQADKNAGEGICFDHSSALVKDFKLITTDYVTLEFLVKACNTSDCYGTLISYTKDKTFTVRHSSEVVITWGASQWFTNFRLEDKEWNQISIVFDKTTYELNLYYFDRTGMAGRKYLQFTEDLLPNDGYLGLGRWQPSPDPGDAQPGVETFKGCIDQVRFWNRTYDSMQIQNHWNVTYQGTEDNMVAIWKFDNNRKGYTYDKIHDVQMIVPTVPFPAGNIDYSDAPIPFQNTRRAFPFPVAFNFAGRRRRKRSLLSEIPLTDIITHCEYIFVSSNLATSCTGVGSQMTEKYFFDCLADMYYGEDITDAMTSTLAYADYCQTTLGLASWPAQALCNYFGHDAGFPDWIGDNCDVACISGSRHPNDNNTCLCDNGYWGSNCSLTCPGGSENPCSGYGTCDVVTGVCPCPVPRRGSTDCSTCTSGWTGNDCEITLSSSTISNPIAKVSDLGHVLNLDGVGFGFEGLGEYHLLQLRPNIIIEGKFIMCHQNFSCLNFVGMRVGSGSDGYAKITVQAPYLTSSEPKIYINSALNTVRKVAYFRNFEIRRASLHEVILDVYNSVQVTIRARKRHLDLTVTVPTANVPATVGLLAGGGSSSWTDKYNYMAHHWRIDSTMGLCHNYYSTQGTRSSSYYSGTMSLPTSSVVGAPSSATLDLDAYFARYPVASCDSVMYYPDTDFSSQKGDGYTLKFDSTAVYGGFDTVSLLSSNLSVELLVKADSTGSGGTVFSFANTVVFALFIDPSRYLMLLYAGNSYTTDLQVEQDVWNKILFVYESEHGDVNLYLFDQNSLVKRRVLSIPTGIFDTTGRFAIGQGLPPDDGVAYSGLQDFKGEVDNVRFWKIIVEPTMIIDIADMGMSLSDHTIRAAWTFDEAEGDVAYDLIQGATLHLPSAPWAAPIWTPSNKANTQQVDTSPLVHYFVNKTLETEAETFCDSLVTAVAAQSDCTTLIDGMKSFYLMQCVQQVATNSDPNAAYLAMYDLGDVCHKQLNAASWPLTSHCTSDKRRGTDCVTSCVFGDWDGVTCTCYEGFSGTDCSSACPTANGVYCNGHGTCSSGTCVCDHNWSGTTCTSCASGWTGSECTIHYGSRLTSNPRTGFISATGEVITYDGASYTFSGVSGVYRVSQDPSDGLYVQAHTVFCEFGTCIDAIGVQMNSRKVTVFAPPRPYALPKVKLDGTEITIAGTSYTIYSWFTINVMRRNSIRISITSPYQLDVTITSLGKFLQTGLYCRSYMCSSSLGLLGECDSSNSNDLYYSTGSYSQATLMSQLSSLYSVTFSSSIFSLDAAEFSGLTSNTKAGFNIGYLDTTLQSEKLTYNFATNESFTLSFSYRPQNTAGALLSYSKNTTFAVLNSNPVSIQIGTNTYATPATSVSGDWNQIVLSFDRELNEVHFFHYANSHMSYKTLNLGSHDFLEADGWLTLGQWQVSKNEHPFTVYGGADNYDGDIADLIVWSTMLPHVVITQTLQLKANILDFASSDVIYMYRFQKGTAHTAEDLTGRNNLQFGYAPWQETTWKLSDMTVTELPARNEDQWDMTVDYDKLNRQTTANTLCDGFFSASVVTTTCSGVDADFRNQLHAQCVESYVNTGEPESVLHSMLAFTDLCGYVATLDVSTTTLCDAQFQSIPWVELRCSGCEHGYKIANGSCVCYPGYWGTSCDGTCPGGVDTPCNNHGTCKVDGTCTCDINWAGSSCSSCETSWTGTDCSTAVGDYISDPYTTAVAQVRSQKWVTTFDGNTFFLNTDDVYLLLRVHNTNFAVYARQTTCGDDPKTFTCFDAFMVRHGSSYYFADWTRQDETSLRLKTLGDDVIVLTQRSFGTLTISRTSLNSFQFLESTAMLRIDVTLYDHGPDITMQFLRKTDLVSLTLSGLLASCDTQFAARATTCGTITMCHPSLSTSYIGHCQTTVSSTSFASLASSNVASTSEKSTFLSLAGPVPSHSVTEYMLYVNRTGLISEAPLTLPQNGSVTFELIYNPSAHGGVVFAYGDALANLALVDNDTSLYVVYGSKVVELGAASNLSAWNQVDLVWKPEDSELEVFFTTEVDPMTGTSSIYTVRTELDSNAFMSGGNLTFGQMLPGVPLSTNDHLTHFVGYLGELRVYTRPHNPSVIMENQFIDVTENTPDLLHAWNFDLSEGYYYVDLKYSINLIATNITESPIWSAAPYTLNVKDGATSFYVTLPKYDHFSTVARQKCESWFTNSTLRSGCELGLPFIQTYKEQCYEDIMTRRNYSEGMKSVHQFALFCLRLQTYGGSTVLQLDTLNHTGRDLCQEFPEAVFQGYWEGDCSVRCVFGYLHEDGECHCTDPYWGPECDMSCPVSNTPDTSVCDSHGHCRKTDGVCVCQSRWTGVAYDYENYTQGYVDGNANYACETCSDDWHGVDCSTAVLNRYVNGSDAYAVISSAVIVTLDGASMELTRTGSYRLLSSVNITLDAYFKQCKGRHDCRALQEIALDYNNGNIASISVVNDGLQVAKSEVDPDPLFNSWSAPMSNRWGDVLVYCARSTFCRLTIDHVIEIAVEAFNGEMIAGIIVSQNHTGYDGLLGNADGDWLNEFYTPGPYSTGVYISEYLSAHNKSQEAETYHTVTGSSTVLNHTDLSTVVTATGGWAINGNQSFSVVFLDLNLTTTDEFTMEMWVYVETVAGHTYDLLSFTSNLGNGALSLENGQLKLAWQKTHTSHVSVSQRTWTYVAMTWRSSDGLMYFYTFTAGAGATGMEMEWGFPYGSNITIYSTAFGGATTDAVSIDYARIWSVVRDINEITTSLGTYDTKMYYGLEFLALFDEGTDTVASASIVKNDTVLYVQGTVTDSHWVVSDIPTTDIFYPFDLPAIVNQTDAVDACILEFNTSLNDYCQNFGAIKQLFVELCISDYIRMSDPTIIKMAASAFAFYCQAISQEDECNFKGYLDFCPTPTSSSDMLPLILGAVFGTLLCCSCSIPLAAIAKKKLMSEKPPEKPEGPEGQDGPESKKPDSGPEGEKGEDGFVEKNFTGGGLPPDAKPPVPPPSTDMYNYLNKMSDGVEGESQDLFKEYNRSPSVNSIALSLQSYGIGSGATSPTIPTSPSTTSLGQIAEEPSNPTDLARHSSLRRPSLITPVNSPRVN